MPEQPLRQFFARQLGVLRNVSQDCSKGSDSQRFVVWNSDVMLAMVLSVSRIWLPVWRVVK